MQVNLVGMKDTDFKAEDGSNIVGNTLFVLYEKDGVAGLVADKVFVKKGIPFPAGFEVGKTVDIVFNRFGKVHELRVIQ